MMTGYRVDNLGLFIELANQIGADFRMTPFGFVINRFAYIMQKSATPRQFTVQTQFFSHRLT